MELYIGTRIILAEPMDEVAFLSTVKGQDATNRETCAGYLVIYDDGYRSWSPKPIFERAYRRITDAEIALLCG